MNNKVLITWGPSQPQFWGHEEHVGGGQGQHPQHQRQQGRNQQLQGRHPQHQRAWVLSWGGVLLCMGDVLCRLVNSWFLFICFFCLFIDLLICRLTKTYLAPSAEPAAAGALLASWAGFSSRGRAISTLISRLSMSFLLRSSTDFLASSSDSISTKPYPRERDPREMMLALALCRNVWLDW